jgi:preprotein translocase subunit SecG
MHRARRAAMVAIALVLVAGVLIYSERRSGSAATISASSARPKSEWSRR